MNRTLFFVVCLFLLFPSLALAGEKVFLANEINWPPYYGQDLPKGGYITEIIRQAFKRAGYDIEIKWLPWKRALFMAETGEVDGLGGAYYTEERAKIFLYSEVIDTTRMVFFKRKDTEITYKSLSDLKGKRIGIGQGYGLPDRILEAEYLNLVEIMDMEHNLKMLISGRVDLIIGSEAVILDLIFKKFPEAGDEIEVFGDPLEEETISLALSKNIPDAHKILEAFNKGLKQLKEEGRIEGIKREFGLY